MSLNLSLRQLMVFREVMRCGSVSEAAKTLHRSQPAVSAMLSNMENELGFVLFERRGNRLMPKPEAHFFMEEVNRVLDDFNRATHMMGEVARLQAGQLRVACMPAASLFLVPRLISEFVQKKPEVKVSLMSNSSTAVHEWVASQQFDVGIAEVPTERSSLLVEPIDAACLCALRADDPLARKKKITPADLDAKPMAVLFEEHFTAVGTRAAFAHAGASFNQRFELRAFISGFDFVEQGLAYCVCDPISAASYRLYTNNTGPLVFRPFEPRVAYTFAILRPAFKPSSLMTDAFCQQLTARISTIMGDAIR
jgi:DNA-binding transcriptional LysR family regulator